MVKWEWKSFLMRNGITLAGMPVCYTNTSGNASVLYYTRNNLYGRRKVVFVGFIPDFFPGIDTW